MGPGVDTDFSPDIYAVFIFSRWICYEEAPRQARACVEFRIQRYIEIRGKPKTVFTERRAAAAALKSLGFAKCADRVSQMPTEKKVKMEQIERLAAQ